MTVDRTLTVGHTLRAIAARYADHEALVMGSQRYTYAQVLAAACQYANALQRMGLQAGDHVGILMPNCVEYVLLFYACALVGLRPVHLNARYKSADLKYVIQDSDMRILITSAKQREFADYAAMLRELYPALTDWRIGQPLQLVEAPLLRAVYYLHATEPHQWGSEQQLVGDAASVHSENTDPEQIALIMYTSGTTANPKACLLSHRALEYAGRALAKRFEMTVEDRFWDPLPFFHMSTMLPMAACRASGATFIAQEHFEASASLAEIVSERATVLFPSFPTLTAALYGHPDFSREALQRVRLVNNVGPPDLLRRFAAQLPHAVHVTAYGLTEAGGVIAFNELSDTPEQLTETSGRPFDGIDVKIVDPDTLEARPLGMPGEILIRGPSMFSGYYNDAPRTEVVYLNREWVRSGDLGALTPEGRIRYLGRLKDMLKVGGENVAALEIEGFLCTHPAVKVAQVIAVPDERLQEVAAAFVELKDGCELTGEELVRYCVGRIASFKVPRYVQCVTEWPMSATKIQKFKLSERVDTTRKLDPAQFK
jgi:acyl-CoA synthetase (AMP-forming)/AMP-acid ligase II